MWSNQRKAVAALWLAFGALAATAATRGAPAKEAAPRLDAQDDPLPEEAVARLGTTRLRDGGWLRGLVFSPDGRTLVSDGTDGVRTWDVATGRQLRRFSRGAIDDGDTMLPSGISSLSSDGKRLALAADGAIQLWEVGSGKMVRSFGEKVYYSVRFAPDGKRLAVLRAPIPGGGERGQAYLEIWDATTGRRLSCWDTGKATDSSPQGRPESYLAPWTSEKILIVVDDNSDFCHNKVHFWDVATERLTGEIDAEAIKGPVALSADGALLAMFAEQGNSFTHRVRILDATSGKEKRRLVVEGKKDEIPPVWSKHLSALAFAPDGKVLVTASQDGTLIVWDLAAGAEVRRFALGLTYPCALAVSPDGKSLAAAGCAAIRLFDLVPIRLTPYVCR